MSDDEPIRRYFNKKGQNVQESGIQSAVRQADFKHVFSPPITFQEFCSYLLRSMYEDIEPSEGVTFDVRPFNAILPINE